MFNDVVRSYRFIIVVNRNITMRTIKVMITVV